MADRRRRRAEAEAHRRAEAKAAAEAAPEQPAHRRAESEARAAFREGEWLAFWRDTRRDGGAFQPADLRTLSEAQRDLLAKYDSGVLRRELDDAIIHSYHEDFRRRCWRRLN